MGRALLPSAILAIAIGFAVRAPILDEPLLEGAAGKQTHTAMVARNLYRGEASWLRPRVDDVGPPGYFVKELPVLPLLAAATYGVGGEPRDWVGRLLAALAWLSATILVVRMTATASAGIGPGVAGAWYALAPLGVVYSSAFMNDAFVVAGSLAALSLGLGWERRPSAGTAVLAGLATGAALLLKPHAALWLGPALLVLALTGRAASGRQRIGFLATIGAGALLAGPWYLHAWRIQRAHPVSGTIAANDWIDPSLWATPEIYATLLQQLLFMVLTPLGAALAVLGMGRAQTPRPFRYALLAWSGGVLLQCWIFATRLLDEPARRSEYYLLAMVPAAAMWIGLGAERARAWLPARPALRRAAYGAAVVAMLGPAALAATEALAPPSLYARLLADCETVRRVTRPSDEILVLTDRPGIVHYYCQRRGLVLVPAEPDQTDRLAILDGASAARVTAAQLRARYFFVPFPDLLAGSPGLRAALEREWRPLGGLPEGVLLYERRPPSAGAISSGSR